MIASILCIAALLLPSFAGVSFPPDVEEKGGIRALTPEGKERWKAHWTMVSEVDADRLVVELTEQGQGVLSPFHKKVQWDVRATWLSQPELHPRQVERIIASPEGERLETVRLSLDWNGKTARFERIGANGKKEQKTLKIPSDTWTPEGLAVVLRTMDFAPGKSVRAHLLTYEPKVYDVRFKVTGRETLTTPNGPVECYRVAMNVDLGFANLFKFFIPDTTFWFAVAEPHMWVRYQGLESGRGTPVIVRQMTSFEREKR